MTIENIYKFKFEIKESDLNELIQELSKKYLSNPLLLASFQIYLNDTRDDIEDFPLELGFFSGGAPVNFILNKYPHNDTTNRNKIVGFLSGEGWELFYVLDSDEKYYYLHYGVDGDLIYKIREGAPLEDFALVYKISKLDFFRAILRFQRILLEKFLHSNFSSRFSDFNLRYNEACKKLGFTDLLLDLDEEGGKKEK
ncbi:hypothetical protein H6501_03110 [Candidatus Woesearchaeota archaeon]|nr:hypothetical protein [Candidatus Woesearchaeota archaeon]USN43638.1 MAG: hypothetical protein H6500_04570 [Candidatus Woesearchaeota archaeon]